MKKDGFFQKICLCLALITCLYATGCAKDNKTAPKTQEETETSQAKPQDAVTYDAYLDAELLPKMETWRGSSSNGHLEDTERIRSTVIQSADHLTPYRGDIAGLTAEEEARFLADNGGTVLLIELKGETERTLYGISSVLKDSNMITVYISQEEGEEAEPLYTYFLLYLPNEIYNGESFNFVF